MGLMDLFRRQPPAAELPKGKRAAKQAAADHEATVQRLRQQARRRLLGAAVLVGIAIVAFPLVFETQPRPVPMDLPIVIPDRTATARPDPARAALPASLPEAAQQTAPAAAPEASAVARLPAPVADTPPAETVTRPAPSPAATQPAAPVVAQTTAQPPASAPDAARFVVQVGAFADRKSAQEARQRLEARGLKTYTQVASTKDGDRIRVRLGPFTERAEADKAVAKAKAAGLDAKVLTL